jgi:ketosteroid isomerase-like protein
MAGTSRSAVVLVAALLLLQPTVQCRGKDAMSTPNADATETRNEELVRASFSAWQAGTGSPFDLLSDDASWTIVGNSARAGTYVGREAFLRDVIRPFNARMSQALKPTIRELYADGDTIIVFFDARGVARDGHPYVNTYAWFLDFSNGRVQRAHAFFDSLAFDALWSRVPPVQTE